MQKSRFHFVFEYVVFVNKYSGKFVDIYLEKLVKNMVSVIHFLNKRFFLNVYLNLL